MYAFQKYFAEDAKVHEKASLTKVKILTVVLRFREIKQKALHRRMLKGWWRLFVMFLCVAKKHICIDGIVKIMVQFSIYKESNSIVFSFVFY